MKSLPLLLLLSCVTISLSGKTKISDYVNICSRTDPKLKECLHKAAEQIFPHLSKGIRDFGIPPMNPLELPFMDLSQSNQPVGLKLNITNSVHTWTGDKIKNVEVDWAKGSFLFTVSVEKYVINGQCHVGGRILLLPITGKGNCLLTAYNVTTTFTFKLKPEMKNGKEYFKVLDGNAQNVFEKGSFVLDGLFGGNKQLGQTTNRFLNENSMDVFKEMTPSLNRVWTDLYNGLFDRFFSSIPADELFKP